jgi:hypothetical protein
VNESCVDQGECELLRPFVDGGKAVLHVEYDNRDVEQRGMPAQGDGEQERECRGEEGARSRTGRRTGRRTRRPHGEAAEGDIDVR